MVGQGGDMAMENGIDGDSAGNARRSNKPKPDYKGMSRGNSVVG